MNNLLRYYTVASYILIIIAGFLGLFELLAFLIIKLGPAELISLFVITAVVIYSFTSFNFLIRGIQNGRQCKPALKDWIKINAYISVVFGSMLLVNIISFISSPANMAEMLKQAAKMQEQLKAPGASAQSIMATFRGVLFFMTGYALVLLSHVFISLRLVKDKSTLFGERPPQD